MSETVGWLIFLACSLGALICLANLVDRWWKESIREIRDVWHEDEDEDEEKERPRRRRGS